MKKTLLLLIFTMLFSTAINAQNTVWDFGLGTTTLNSVAASNAWLIADNSTGVASTDPATTIQKSLLNFTGHTTSGTFFGIFAASAKSFSDGYGPTVNGCKTGGGGGPAVGSYLPTVRYFSFNVSGACTVKVWIRHGSSSGVDRNVYITNGTALLGTGAVVNTTQIGTPAADNPLSNTIATGTVTSAGPVYIYGDNAIYVYKIEVSGATVNTPSLANNNFQQESSVSVFSNGKQVSVTNITSETQVNVYSMTGALVKSFTTSTDQNFDLNSGFYIVNVNSAEGQKSAKVVVK